MSKVTELVWKLAEPVVTKNGCEIWDVEYLKEAGQWFLRLYIDKDGGVSIDDCEIISRELDKMLDEADPIPESYVFEVSSAGADRALKRPGDFERYMGSSVDVKLYRPVDGAKVFTGALKAYAGGDVTIDTPAGERTFEKKLVAAVNLAVSF